MFEDYQGLINLDEILFKEYNYNFDGDYNKLLSQSFVETEMDDQDIKFWIAYKNERYLVKIINEPEINIWGELLSQEMAKF